MSFTILTVIGRLCVSSTVLQVIWGLFVSSTVLVVVGGLGVPFSVKLGFCCHPREVKIAGTKISLAL